MVTNVITKCNGKDKVVDFRDKLSRSLPDEYAMMHQSGGKKNGGKTFPSVIEMVICDFTKGTGDKSVTCSVNIDPTMFDEWLTVCRCNVGTMAVPLIGRVAKDAQKPWETVLAPNAVNGLMKSIHRTASVAKAYGSLLSKSVSIVAKAVKGAEKKDNGTSFNVRCPFCNDTKYHMNINTVKNAYSCVKCSGGEKGQGALDLYARVAHGVRCVKGQNSREMYRKLCDDLHIEAPVRSRVQKTQLPEVVEIHRASDEVVDKAYRKLLDIKFFQLSDLHRENLHRRGFSDETIERNGYRSISADFPWVNRYRKAKEQYQKLIPSIRKDNILKRRTPERLIAGLIAASILAKCGCELRGVPGFFRIDGVWCFNLEPGMLIPTRNAVGQIVALQVRRDKPSDWNDYCKRTGQNKEFLRYMTISAKGLPDGVTTDISQAHFPLGNDSLDDPETAVCITEGPLKADAAVELKGNRKMFFIALHGTSNTKTLPAIFAWLKGKGVETVFNVFDMDKVTNVNVAKAGKRVRAIAAGCGIKLAEKCWDAEYAQQKLSELNAICCEHGIFVPTTFNVFTDLANVSQELAKRNIRHSRVKNADGLEEKHYWSDKTKGIDDYLLSIRTATGGEGASA